MSVGDLDRATGDVRDLNSTQLNGRFDDMVASTICLVNLGHVLGFLQPPHSQKTDALEGVARFCLRPNLSVPFVKQQQQKTFRAWHELLVAPTASRSKLANLRASSVLSLILRRDSWTTAKCLPTSMATPIFSTWLTIGMKSRASYPLISQYKKARPSSDSRHLTFIRRNHALAYTIFQMLSFSQTVSSLDSTDAN